MRNRQPSVSRAKGVHRRSGRSEPTERTRARSRTSTSTAADGTTRIRVGLRTAGGSSSTARHPTIRTGCSSWRLVAEGSRLFTSPDSARCGGGERSLTSAATVSLPSIRTARIDTSSQEEAFCTRPLLGPAMAGLHTSIRRVFSTSSARSNYSGSRSRTSARSHGRRTQRGSSSQAGRYRPGRSTCTRSGSTDVTFGA